MKAAIPATEFVCAHAQTLMSLRTQTAKLPLGAVTKTEANANANANILSTTLDRLVWTLCVSGYAHPALGKENHGEGKIEVKEDSEMAAKDGKGITKRPLLPPKPAELSQKTVATTRTAKRPLLPPKPPELLPQMNGLPKFKPVHDSTCFPAAITPETQRCLEIVLSFDPVANEDRIAQVWPQKCSYVVKEILHTERIFVQSLGEVIRGYLTPLYSYLLSSGQGPNFICTVFSNIIKLHQIHMKLLENLQKSCTNPREFGQVFLQWDFLSHYSVYCTNYAKGNECLEKSLQENENLRAFIEECQKLIGHLLPLDSQLIKPVQRILKYRLFLEELIKHMDKKHEAYKSIQDALVKMSEVTEQINTSFCKPKKPSRLAPSIIARRRCREVRDLQRSRTLSPQRKPVRHVSLELTTLPRRYPYTSPLGIRKVRHASVEEVSFNCVSEDYHHSMPCVHELKIYFESLSQIEDRGLTLRGGPLKHRRRSNGRITSPRTRSYNISQRPKSEKLDMITSELKRLHLSKGHNEASPASKGTKN